MFGRLAAIPCILLLTCSLKAQDTLTAIYAGEIPTYDLVYDNSCNGPATTLSVMLPAGDNFEVTNVHIAYTMTAATNGWMSDQRSKVRCVNSGVEESEQSGAGDTPGTMVYDRNATIANGTYIGGTVLEFEMWALRTWGGVAGCNTQHNKVDSGTWTITVFLGAEIPHPNVGIRTATPAQSLDVNGKIRLGDDATPPVAGTMRWNSETQDFEGFDGTRWRSLTRSAGGWGTQTTTESAAMSGMHNNALGWSVAVDGDHAVIGSLDADTVYMYRRQGDAWVFHQSFAAPDDDGTSQYFGWSVAIHGAYAVIGSPQKSVNGNSAQGKAYVYHLIGDTWTFQDSLVASDGDVFWSFGWDVDLSGDYLIVGAPGAEVDGEVEQGNIYVYHRDGASWNEHGILSPASGSAGDVFGMYITIEGNEIVIGSPNTTSEGECYAFSRQGLQWTELPVITPLVGIPASSFGNSVCIEEERLFIGSRDSADFQGIVYIFEKSGGAWVETSQLPPPSQELFGFGWSLDASGDALIVGALGGAFVYRLIAGTWQKEVTLHPSDDAVGGQFGFAVGISVSGAVVAAPYLDLPSADSAGKVYFYNYQ